MVYMDFPNLGPNVDPIPNHKRDEFFQFLVKEFPKMNFLASPNLVSQMLA